MGDASEHLAQWRAHVAAPTPESLWAMLHEAAVFESPVVHTPQRGRELAFAYLSGAERVLGGPGFRYTGEWLGPDSAVLEFETELQGIFINGIDMIRWDADGRIVHFKVMVRPLKAIQLLHRLMAEELQKA
ncbi:nuclear transport factor 2 family protein [Thermaurantiacus sp.]